MEHQRKPLPALTRTEKYLGLTYLVFQFALLPVLLQVMASVFSLDFNGTLINVLYFAINFISVIAIFSKLLRKSLLRATGDWEALLLTTAIGFGIYRLCSTVLGLGVMLLFPDFSNLNDTAVLEVLGKYPLVMLVSTVILAPVVEEGLFRGLIFGWLQEKNEILAYVGSTLLFAAIHVMQYIGLYSTAEIFVALVLYLPAGAVFAWAYRRSGSLLTPILIHAANNLLAFLVLR